MNLKTIASESNNRYQQLVFINFLNRCSVEIRYIKFVYIFSFDKYELLKHMADETWIGCKKGGDNMKEKERQLPI